MNLYNNTIWLLCSGGGGGERLMFAPGEGGYQN